MHITAVDTMAWVLLVGMMINAVFCQASVVTTANCCHDVGFAQMPQDTLWDACKN